MHVTLVYFDHDVNEGKGQYSMVKLFLHDLKARFWVQGQKDPFGRTNLTWRELDDGSAHYGAYRLTRVEVDDMPLTEDEVRIHEDRMIEAVLATLSPDQRKAFEARMPAPRP